MSAAQNLGERLARYLDRKDSADRVAMKAVAARRRMVPAKIPVPVLPLSATERLTLERDLARAHAEVRRSVQLLKAHKAFLKRKGLEDEWADFLAKWSWSEDH